VFPMLFYKFCHDLSIFFRGIRPTIDKETHEAMASLLQHIPGAQPRPKPSVYGPATQLPSMVSVFLRGEDCPRLNTLEYPMSPPIFPRQMSKAEAPGFESLSDISSLGLIHKLKVEEEEEDLSTGHMRLVDGWSQSVPC
jgi:hypothetical protein